MSLIERNAGKTSRWNSVGIFRPRAEARISDGARMRNCCRFPVVGQNHAQGRFPTAATGNRQPTTDNQYD